MVVWKGTGIMRVTEVNLTDSGGAFSLIYAIQNSLYSRGKTDVIFDYFSMGKFEKKNVTEKIEKMGGKIHSADLRHNRILGFIRLPRLFYKYCKENNVEVVHIHSDSAFILQIYSIPAKLAGVPNIIAHSHCSGMNGDYRIIKKMVHVILRPFVGFSANVFLSCSDLATKWLYKNELQSKTIFLKNGVDIEKFKFSQVKRIAYRNELGLKSETIALGVVGDMGFQKNPLFICDVMKILENKYKLFFVGDGPCKKDVEEYVKNNKLEDKIVFLGRRNVSDILNALDVFVMPSKFEGLPVSGVEAQTNGLPCVFSTKITKQVGILNSSVFESIDSVEDWSKAIKSLKINTNERCYASEIVAKAGFDIGDTADHLYKIYKEL